MAAAFLPMTEDSPPSPISIYGITKWQQEQLANSVAETYGMAVTTLRFFDVYGPGQSLGNPYTGVLRTFFRRATARQSIEVYEDGKMLRDFVFVADVVEALTRSLNNEKAFGAMLNVGLGQAITLHDIARQMFRSLKIEPQLGGSGRYRVGDIRHAVADVRRLQQTLDFVPQTSFVEGLQAYVDWALKQNSFASDEKAEKELANVALLRAAR
jgi:dTDP-L-rhamnose 4-epimerase